MTMSSEHWTYFFIFLFLIFIPTVLWAVWKVKMLRRKK